ncbi:MAG: sugar ABC transporter permease [Clostridiales bacterium]|nr:sugar ABC transporter permease [Clostridiales bacterium]HBM81052.1 lactose ABC transporter permease [Clostridiaceae bacterium]
MTFRNKKIKDTMVAFAFMAPALILLIVFLFYPIIYSLPLAFYDYSIVGQTKFIGWDNFTRALHDNEFWISIKNSVTFVLVVPPIQILSILLAILVNRKLPGIKFFRALFYIPVVTSMIAVSIIWGFLFDPDGIINGFMISHGWINEPIYYLQNPSLAMPSIMFITLWQGLGYYMMLYLAGLQSIPAEIEEAALVDGANKFKTFFKIKIPLLKPYVWFCTFISLLSAVGVFDIVFALTSGGPNNATLVTNYYSYTKAFTDFNFGYSAAIGLLLSIVTTILSIAVFIYGKRGGMTYSD